MQYTVNDRDYCDNVFNLKAIPIAFHKSSINSMNKHVCAHKAHILLLRFFFVLILYEIKAFSYYIHCDVYE